MGRYRTLLWLAVPIIGYIGVMAAIDLRLNRSAEGPSCAAFSRGDLIGAGYDFSPRTTDEKMLRPAEVRSAGGQRRPDCTVSHTSFRCHQIGPAMVRVSHYGGQHRYFEVPDGKMAVLYGREGEATCVLQDPVA